jgi:glycosyltransferase involved in cell wall biosynthesis
MLKISIVTPLFNQARFLEECLLSVKEKNYSNLKHKVVDGASTDGTVGILKHYSELSGWEHLRWLSEPDRCQADTINKGLTLATG